jgi:hypothetical protein
MAPRPYWKGYLKDEETGRVVDTEHKGRGYELTRGKYVAIEDEELAAVEIESTHTIEIDSFVPKEEIEARQRNIAVLSDLLAAVGLIIFKAPAYARSVIRSRSVGGIMFCDALRSQKIFIPTHWREILVEVDFPFELELSRQLLTLPCDHRYTVEDMRRLAIS